MIGDKSDYKDDRNVTVVLKPDGGPEVRLSYDGPTTPIEQILDRVASEAFEAGRRQVPAVSGRPVAVEVHVPDAYAPLRAANNRVPGDADAPHATKGD